MVPHKGSQETFEYIAKWIAPDFFFSLNDKWLRFGILGVLGDFVLSCTQGDVLEIGVGESSIYLSHAAKKYGRKIYHCDIAPGKIDNPLTVPGYLNEDIGIFVRGSSDELFTLPIHPIALGFIDGDHTYEQAKKDFWNLFLVLVNDGYIFLHDTYPPDESYLDENRCGGVWQLRCELEKNSELDVFTFPRGCAMGVGLTMVRKKPAMRPFYNE